MYAFIEYKNGSLIVYNSMRQQIHVYSTQESMTVLRSIHKFYVLPVQIGMVFSLYCDVLFRMSVHVHVLVVSLKHVVSLGHSYMLILFVHVMKSLHV